MINSAVVKLITFDCDGVLADTETLANQILYQKLIGKGMPISEKEMTQLFLGLTGLLPLFENNLFSATQVANGKPAPDLFLLAADHFAVKPEHCLVIEDSLTGCRAPRLQVCSYWYTTSQHQQPTPMSSAIFSHYSVF